MNAGQGFILESTLAGKYLMKVIENAKNKGYLVSIVYVFLENSDVCIERIKIRVKLGGHHIPDSDVVRRFYRSKNNFWHLYRNMADNWLMYYNTPSEAVVQVAVGNKNEYIIESEKLFEIFLKDIKP